VKLVNFEIKRIYAGWFYVEFKGEDKQIMITASDVWDNDSPKYFLKMITECLIEKQFNKYVVFDEEPGTYIVSIEKNETVILTVCYSKIEGFEWNDLELHGDLSLEQIKSYIPIEKELIKIEIDLGYLAKTIYRSFEEYRFGTNRKEYEENWMKYPEAEFKQLSKLLKIK
jgi:hypothetical protein